MSCRSISATARSLIDTSHGSDFHRSVRFSSECRSSTRLKKSDIEHDKEAVAGSLTRRDSMSQSAPASSLAFQFQDTPAPQAASCRFPKLEDCAHFHYERVSLGGLSIECVSMPNEEMGAQCSLGDDWVCLKVRSHVTDPDTSAANYEWTLTRNKEHFLHLDDMLHRCIYDRHVSGLPNLSEELNGLETDAYNRLIADYVHHLSMIADDTINCGPVLNWLQMDNKGHKLLVCGEDSSSINTPAVAAAYSVRPYVSQARDELSFDVGDMISIIDMPGPNESLWWRGKRGFRVGFFPHHCVAVIGDKVPRHMTQPPPIVGSVAVAPIKPVLRKHGKLISLFRSFILSRPSRRSLKQQGILRERVFGCDLGEHLLNCKQDVPQVLVECAKFIESRGAVDGVYRLSGGAGLTQRLRAAFDAGDVPALAAPAAATDPHAPASLLKMYFRELPNPLCTYQLYESFVAAVGAGGGSSNPDGLPERLRAVKDVVRKLPPPHYRTLAYLMRHLRRVSLLGAETGMTARNMAIVWAPNLLRAPRPHHALQGVAVQAVVTEFLIVYAEELFGEGPPSPPPSRAATPPQPPPARRPKSLPLHPPATLLTLDEARRRSPTAVAMASPSPAPVPSGAIAAAASASLSADAKPKYIEVGSGPDNLPRYHTVLDLPLGRKTRAEGGWRGLFSRKPHPLPPLPIVSAPLQALTPPHTPHREVRSCESLSDSESVSLPPAAAPPPLSAPPAPAPAPAPPASAAHSRCRSCDSYFEPWQAELQGMRLRLAPQEASTHMFSEEDRPSPSPPPSPNSSPPAPNSPARAPLEDILPNLTFIDGDSPRIKAAEKRERSPPPAPLDQKRLCRHPAPQAPIRNSSNNLNSPTNRNSPNNRNSPTNRNSLTLTPPHSTLIRVDWPSRTPSEKSIQKSVENENNKRTIEVNNCEDCKENKCLKCELEATDYENMKYDTDIAYKTLNRLSVLSSSTDSERKLDKLNLMTSSHESSSSYSRHSDDYEGFDFRPNYSNLQSSSTSKSSPGSPLKSPLKSTISITYRSPTKIKKIDRSDDTPTDERDSIYEDVVLEKSLAIVEDASVPEVDASLPTPAQQPDADVYSQVKFFKKSIEEVNAMILETPLTEPHYENVSYGRDYENISVDTLQICEKDLINNDIKNNENSNVVVKSQNVKRLAIRFESPTEQKEPFIFEKFKAEIKYPSLERKDETKKEINTQKPPKSPKTNDLSKNNAKSLDENAFFKEFGEKYRRNSLEAKETTKTFVPETTKTFLPDLNLNVSEENTKYTDPVTPTSENKISLIQRFETQKPELKNIFTPDTEKKMSRERIEKYKEERRNFLREKYSSQSFRSNPEQLTRIKIKKDPEQSKIESCERLKGSPKFERRNTVDLGQRMRFSLTKSADGLDDLSPSSKEREDGAEDRTDMNEKLSPSYNIRDMTAMFEQKSQLGHSG